MFFDQASKIYIKTHFELGQELKVFDWELKVYLGLKHGAHGFMPKPYPMIVIGDISLKH